MTFRASNPTTCTQAQMRHNTHSASHVCDQWQPERYDMVPSHFFLHHGVLTAAPALAVSAGATRAGPDGELPEALAKVDPQTLELVCAEILDRRSSVRPHAYPHAAASQPFSISICTACKRGPAHAQRSSGMPSPAAVGGLQTLMHTSSDVQCGFKLSH